MELNKYFDIKIKSSIIHTVEFNQQDADTCYVMDFDVNAKYIVAAGSNNLIKVYDRTNHSIVSILKGHTDTIQQVRFFEDTDTVLSCSSDRSFRIWNIKDQSFKSLNQKGEVFSFDVSKHNNTTLVVMAVGSGIAIWDLSSNKLVKSYESSHTEDVTRVKFHPLDKSKVVSCSVDGLICVHDLNAVEEDDEILYVLNAEDSIGNFGFFGNDAKYIYTLSHTERLTTWDLSTGAKLKHYGDLRTILTEKYQHDVNYFVSCDFEPSTQSLILYAGDYNGGFFIYTVTADDVVELSKPQSQHTDIIRNVYWDRNNNEIITSSEDSKICIWINNSVTKESTSPSTSSKMKDDKPRKSPYSK
ncbi:hypothetical protein CYY_008656 [Polysphondylium violaceum]|uniref:WD40 repeat-containing protein n=1 Tax=Polysphondylium violaceum TaxID=133409 RepID=A0A8J4PN27_9MYCE|nr:hypothetical protein CYY_008656 [Polysphondylium violaceum]